MAGTTCAYVVPFSSNSANAGETSQKYAVEKPKTSLYFHQYALDLFRRHEITFRGAILLAWVDHYVNSYITQRHAAAGCFPEHADIHVKSIDRSIGDITWWLQCTDDTAYSTMKSVAAVRPTVLKYHLDGKTWTLRTQPNRGRDFKGSMIVQPDVLDLWLSGLMGKGYGQDMLILANVQSLQMDEKECFVSNREFGEMIGAGPQAAANAIKRLLKSKLLEARYETENMKTTRYLTVPNLSPKSIQSRKYGTKNETPESPIPL